MELAVKLASIVVGERKMRKEKEEILKREDLEIKEKLGLVKNLELRHQIKTYRHLIKVTRGVLKIIQFFSVGTVMLGLCFLGAESENLGVNLFLGLLMLGFGTFGYLIYSKVEEDTYFYRIKLKEVKKELRTLKSQR